MFQREAFILKKGIAVVVIALFITSAVSPMVIGFEADADDDEMEELLDNLAFYCYDESGSSAKYEYYKEKLLKDYSEDEIDIVEDVVQPVELLTSSGGPMDSPWPMKCYDLHHTSRSPYSTENITNLEKWRFYEDGWVEATPAIDDDGTIYFASTDWEVIAVYPNGTLKWRFKTEGFMSGSSPAIAEDGTVYVGSWDTKLYAINPNGTLKWKCGTGGSIFSSPAIAEDGTIYIGSMGPGDKGRITAINPNGTRKWEYDTGYKITSDPAIGDDSTIYIGSGDTYFYAMNPNGTLKWRYKTGDYIKGSASIGDDGTVYVGSFDGYLYAFYPTNGTVKWKYGWIGPGTETNPSIAKDGTIYVGGEDLYAVNPNGTKKWTFDPGDQRIIMWSSPAISADGTIYVGTHIGEVSGGEIIAVNPNGTEKWRKNIADKGWIDSSPSIGKDGTVYIGSGGYWGYLHAFGPVESNSPPETPTISGETKGKTGVKYTYVLRAIDPDINPIKLYIDWGDGGDVWTPELASGQKTYYEHSWSEEGKYTIRVKAKDVLGEESDWAYLEVTMPYSYHSNWWMGWLDRFPLLQWLLGRFIW